MMLLNSYKRGQNGIILRIFIPLFGNPQEGSLGLNNTTEGLFISVIADNESVVTSYDAFNGDIENITTLGTYEEPSAGKCRFKEVNPVMSGVYEIHLSNEIYNAFNCKYLIISVSSADIFNIGGCRYLIPLVDIDPYTNFVNAVLMDNIVHAGVGAQLQLGRLVIHNGTSESAVSIFGNGNGPGINIVGGNSATGHGVQISRGTNPSANDVQIVNSETSGLPTSPTVSDIVTSIYGKLIGTEFTYEQVFKMIAGMMVGKTSGGGTDILVFRDIDDTKDTVTITLTRNNNRSEVVRNP